MRTSKGNFVSLQCCKSFAGVVMAIVPILGEATELQQLRVR